MKFHFLQALRAMAAWLVVADHALLDLTRGSAPNLETRIAWAMGSIGVYIFFVISGFIMVHICWNDFGQSNASTNFLRRRFVRIVPLYWLATIAAFGFHKVSATHGANAGELELLQSLLFIPYLNGDGDWTPILPQGWTLNYEIFFYAVFAASMIFRRRVALTIIVCALVAFTAVGPFLPHGILVYLSSPIVLYFVIGAGLAILWRHYDLIEPKWLSRSSSFLESFGDASYSTYLIHGLALTVLSRIWIKMLVAPSVWFVPIGIVVATIAGLCVHAAIEVPLSKIVLGLSARLVRKTPRSKVAEQQNGG